jgi:hypothetical protein
MTRTNTTYPWSSVGLIFRNGYVADLQTVKVVTLTTSVCIVISQCRFKKYMH